MNDLTFLCLHVLLFKREVTEPVPQGCFSTGPGIPQAHSKRQSSLLLFSPSHVINRLDQSLQTGRPRSKSPSKSVLFGTDCIVKKIFLNLLPTIKNQEIYKLKIWIRVLLSNQTLSPYWANHSPRGTSQSCHCPHARGHLSCLPCPPHPFIP